jgi:hypothetical protein
MGKVETLLTIILIVCVWIFWFIALPYLIKQILEIRFHEALIISLLVFIALKLSLD